MAKLPGAIQGARIVGEKFVHAQRQQNPEGRMPLMDHIRELRNRVVKIALALGTGMIFGFIFFTPVWNVINRRTEPTSSAVVRPVRQIPAALGKTARPGLRSARYGLSVSRIAVATSLSTTRFGPFSDVGG